MWQHTTSRKKIWQGGSLRDPLVEWFPSWHCVSCMHRIDHGCAVIVVCPFSHSLSLTLLVLHASNGVFEGAWVLSWSPMSRWLPCGLLSFLAEPITVTVTVFVPLRCPAGTTLTMAVLSGWLLTVANTGDSNAIIDAGDDVQEITFSHRIQVRLGLSEYVCERYSRIILHSSYHIYVLYCAELECVNIRLWMTHEQ